MDILNDRAKKYFTPDPKILGMLEKAKKTEYNQKEEKSNDFTGAKVVTELGAKAAGIDTDKDKSTSAAMSTVAALAKMVLRLRLRHQLLQRTPLRKSQKKSAKPMPRK